MQNTTNPNHNHTNPCFQFSASIRVHSRLKFSASSESSVISVAILLFSNFKFQISKLIQLSKFNLQNSLKIENSLFKINISPIFPIFPILTFLPCQNMSKTCQKWSISCQKWVKTWSKPVKIRPLFDKNIQKSSEMFRNSPQKRS